MSCSTATGIASGKRSEKTKSRLAQEHRQNGVKGAWVAKSSPEWLAPPQKQVKTAQKTSESLQDVLQPRNGKIVP
jgi:hypothetical protein